MTATLKDEQLLQRSCSSDARGATTVFVLMLLYDRRLFVSLIQIFSRSDVKRRFEPVRDA